MSGPATRITYHVNDTVRVVRPERFIRVGYPLTKQDALDAVERDYSDKVHVFMREIGAENSESLLGGSEYDLALYHDLLNALSSWWLKQRNYGGRERKIYTETDESLQGSTWRVLSKRVVKTGTYNHGGYSGGYDGEPDYDPPYLANEQSHILLTLELIEGKCDPWGIEIEASSVELVEQAK